MIANNRVFHLSGSGGTYLRISGNYSVGAVSVLGNVVNGNGTGTGLSYQQGGASSVSVVSTGNNVLNVATVKSVGGGVTVGGGI